MQKRIIALVLILIAVNLGTSLFSEESDFSINVRTGTDYMIGYTLYSIGWNYYDQAGNKGAIGYKLSELRFPLDCVFGYGNIDVRFLENWVVDLGFSKNIWSPNGKMEDSDWGYWYLNGNSWANSSTLDIFSRSDSIILNAYAIDSDFLYKFAITPGFDVSAGLGFIYKYFYFEVSNLDQWYPSYDTYSAYIIPAYSQHVYVSGVVSTYEVKYIIPLLESSMYLTLFDRLELNLMVGYSPFVKIYDADDHILRSKLMHGDSTGMAFKCTISGRYNFTNNFFAGLNADFLYISASGKQYQYLYNDTSEGPAGPAGSIDMKIESMQFSAGIFLGVAF